MWNDHSTDFLILNQLGPSKVATVTRTQVVLVVVAIVTIPGVAIWLMLGGS